MVINHLLSGMVLQESAPPAMPAQKGKSCLERRLKRCQTDVQMQGQPLQPCIAPRVQRGHPSSRAKILQRALHDACANKNLFTKTPPHQRKNTTTGSQKHHHITPPQKYHHTTTKTPPHHHHNNKPPLGIEPMTSPLLSGCNANWAKLPLPCGKKGAHPLWNWKKVPPPHHHKNTTTPPPQKHHHTKHKNTTTPNTKTQPTHHKNTTTPPHHHPKNTTTPLQKHNHHTTTKTPPYHHHTKTPQKHQSGLKGRLSCMWNNVWNDVQLWRADLVWRQCCNLWVSNYRHQYVAHSGHQQACRSLFPSLPDLLGSTLECPGSPPWEDPNYVWSWGPAELHVERRQNDVQAQGL